MDRFKDLTTKSGIDGEDELRTFEEHDYQALSLDTSRKTEWRVASFRKGLAALFVLLYLLRIGVPYALSRTTLEDPLLNSDGPHPSVTKDVFDWFELEASPELEYTPCHEGFQCARLELPLDYWNGTTNRNITLAVIKLPAKVDVSDPTYRGPVLINPGGPGGSGIDLALRSGHKIQQVVGPSFDIVSFDPRGVGYTTPEIRCGGSASSAEAWRLRRLEEGALTSSDAALGRLWSMSHALGARCSEVDSEDIQRYLTTASVSRDMVEIVEAAGRWREKEALSLLSRCGNAYSTKQARLESLKYKPGQEKLQYWGFSYGTYLGTTFASLFPDRVERLVLDGVVDAEDYAASLWYDNLVDTEKGMNLFYYHCNRVGYPSCPLAIPKGNAEDISKRVHEIVSNLYHNPLPIDHPYVDVISWSDVRNLIFTVLYKPVEGFPFLANVLADLEHGNATVFASILRQYHSYSCPSDKRETSRPIISDLDPIYNTTSATSWASHAIKCTDSDPQQGVTKAAYTAHIQSLLDLSPTIGDLWAAIRLSCIGYPLRPYFRYAGPWQGNTSHPILWVSNTADPVTPLASAKKISKGFPGSRILVQDSPGHCSLSAFSFCTTKHIRDYFQDGILPAEGTVCSVDEVPWGQDSSRDNVAAMSEDYQLLSQAHGGIHKGMYAAGGGFMLDEVMGRIDAAFLQANT